MPDTSAVTAGEALMKVAANLEKLANAIDDAGKREKTAAASDASMDYGTLGSSAPDGADSFTRWLMS